jgi:NAD(P)H-hydrate epimerase
VLAVDIPSGVDGLTGRCGAGVIPADRTVTFAALKPGLLFSPGSSFTGTVEVADIGLDTSRARAHLVQHADVARWVEPKDAAAHKWKSAVWVVAGSGAMFGAARLAAASAQRAGAGMVWLSSPGAGVDPLAPTEAVNRPLPASGWVNEVLERLGRFHAVVAGPGMGRADHTAVQVREFITRCPLPVVVDGDGLFALAWSADGPAAALRARPAATVLTPHDGEYQLLTGQRVPPDRIDAARLLAVSTNAVVLLKGQATVVAEPAGRVYVVTAGDERLATAGSGDVLSGIVGALLAGGVPAFEAAAAGAWIHGRAGQVGASRGLVAGDLPGLIPRVLETL